MTVVWTVFSGFIGCHLEIRFTCWRERGRRRFLQSHQPKAKTAPPSRLQNKSKRLAGYPSFLPSRLSVASAFEALSIDIDRFCIKEKCDCQILYWQSHLKLGLTTCGKTACSKKKAIYSSASSFFSIFFVSSSLVSLTSWPASAISLVIASSSSAPLRSLYRMMPFASIK